MLVTAPAHAVADADVDAVDATVVVVAAAGATAADLTSLFVPAACLSCSHALLHALVSASVPTTR